MLDVKDYFKVYNTHQWNEYYQFDSDLIDDVREDGFVLLSESVMNRECNDY